MKKQLLGKEFELWFSAEEIQKEVKRLAKEIEAAYPDKKPILLSILNGSFIFSADLIRALTGEWSIEFIQASSYKGTTSTGEVQIHTNLSTHLRHQPILILEDILDTGLTLEKIIHSLTPLEPQSIKIAVLFDKPKARLNAIQADFVGKTIESRFIVGYGLDFDGLGRNWDSVYVEVK